MNFFNWMTPKQIYEELTGGPGSGSLSTAQGISHEQMGRELERAFRIQRLAKNVQGGWQGSAADGAYGAAQPLAAAAVDGNQHLYQAQDLLDRQSGSFGRASNSVVPMPAERPEAGMLDEALPWDTDTEKQVKAYQADAQHNIQVFEGYDDASSYNENMPRDYRITNHSGGTMSVTGGDTIDSDDYGRSGGESGGPGNYAPSNGDPGGARYPGESTGGASSGGPLPGGAPGTQTSPSEYRPSPAPGGSPGGYPQSPAAQQPGTMPPGGFVPGPTGGYPGGSGGGAGSGGGSGGPGGRGGGPGGGAAGGSGAGGRVPGPGGGAGALAAEEAAARRGAVGGAAAGGRGGMGPMGAPMGAGRGKGDDDAEHERKVLIEPDPESTFGSDVLTAPQVIGDDAYEE